MQINQHGSTDGNIILIQRSDKMAKNS